MAVCQVCGCKTSDLDFVESTINSQKIRVCSFCGRQLDVFANGDAKETHVKWLKTVSEKTVEGREAQVKSAIDVLLERYAEESDGSASSSVSTNIGKGATSVGYVADTIADLTERIENLETELKIFKLTQKKRLITELFAGLAVGIIIMIIIFTSDFYSSLQMFFS